MIDNIFLQISVVLGITVSIAFVMRMLRQPLIVAYIIAGLVAGPLFLNLVNGGEEFFETFAQFGIVLLLFIVGLSLNFDYIKKMGRTVIAGSLIQFFFTSLFGLLVMYIMGFSFLSSVFIGVAVSFSSTIIVIKLLTDKKDLEALYGRYVVGVLLIQDIIAVLVLVFLNSINLPIVQWPEVFFKLGAKALVLVAIVVLMAKYLLPVLMDKVARSTELLFIFTIAWCFGVASMVYLAGFSIEIGAIIAGVSLGASVYQPEISSRVKPLRDFFIVLFFIVLGSELQFGDLRFAIIPALVLSAFVLIADPIILYIAMRWVGHTRRTSLLAGLTAAQVSEFGFILVFKGRELGFLHSEELAILTIVALITIVFSSYLITYNEQIYTKLISFLNRFGKDVKQRRETEVEPCPVWVFGYHRIGWKVCEALAELKIGFAVIDYNPDAISRLRHRGIPAYFGDAADVEFLSSLPLEKAKMIISTIPESDDQKTMISHVRRLSKKTIIIGNLYHNLHLDDLYESGANYVMMPHLLGGQWMSEVLKHHPWTKKTFGDLRKEQREDLKLRFTMGAHN